MKLLLCCILFFANIGSQHFVRSQYVHNREYFWRDYDGLISPDAVKGGTIDGQTTYIGQVLVSNISSILLANIFRNKTVASIYGNVPVEDNDIKILCSKNVELLRWIKVTPDSFPKITDLIYGGFQNGTRLYIGRAFYGNDTIVGKAIWKSNFLKKGLYISTNDGELLVKSYNILVHRPPQKDYYWRDYFGYMPDDAIKGGIISGENAYIGQGTHDRIEIKQHNKECYTRNGYNQQITNEDLNKNIYAESIPVNIVSGNLTALVYTNTISTTNQNLKVLCSGHPENMIWVHHTDLDSYKLEDFIIGGYKPGDSIGGYDNSEIYFIGKVKNNNDELIKYIRKSDIAPDLLRQNYDAFEILAYKV